MTSNVFDIQRAAVDELERRELSHPDSNETTRSARKGPEIGSTGLKVFGGIITEEHNKAWQQPELYITVDKMRKGDATVASILLAITLPILATEVRVDAKTPDGSKPDPIVQEAAEFIQYNLFSGEVMTRDFLSLLRETMLFLAYGGLRHRGDTTEGLPEVDHWPVFGHDELAEDGPTPPTHYHRVAHRSQW